MKLTRSLTLSLSASIRPALMAALRLVLQTSLGEEGLFTGREHEAGYTISAGQRLVREAHLRSPPSASGPVAALVHVEEQRTRRRGFTPWTAPELLSPLAVTARSIATNG